MMDIYSTAKTDFDYSVSVKMTRNQHSSEHPQRFPGVPLGERIDNSSNLLIAAEQSFVHRLQEDAQLFLAVPNAYTAS